MDGEQFYSCFVNPHAHLPVYTNIHRIRRDVISIVEDYLSVEQLRDLRLNISVVRPLVDKLYEQDDISIGMHNRHAPSGRAGHPAVSRKPLLMATQYTASLSTARISCTSRHI